MWSCVSECPSTGFYLFTRLDAGASGFQAIMQSPKFSRVGTSCSFTFWYYMSGLSIGSLVLDMRSDNKPIQVGATVSPLDQHILD